MITDGEMTKTNLSQQTQIEILLNNFQMKFKMQFTETFCLKSFFRTLEDTLAFLTIKVNIDIAITLGQTSSTKNS